MKLSLSLAKKRFLYQEVIPMQFRMSEVGAGVRIPFDFADRVVLRFRATNGGGEVETKAGGDKPLAPEESAEAGALIAGAEPKWTANLAGPLGPLDPGEYQVQARLRYSPSGIDLETDWLSCEVVSNTSRYLTAQNDKIALNLQHVVQIADGGSGPALCHILEPSSPERIWFSGTAELPAEAQPAISECDFRTGATFDHDITRWLAWVREGKLAVMRLVMSRQDGPAREFVLSGDLAPQIIGPPVQHEDGTLSVLLFSRVTDDESVLTIEKLDPERNGRTTVVVQRFAKRPAMLTAAPDWEGNVMIVASPSGAAFRSMAWPQVGWLASPEEPWRRFAETSMPRFLRLRVAAKFLSPEMCGVLSIGVVTRDGGNFAVLVRIPFTAGTSVPRVEEIRLPDSLLEDGESICGGDITQTIPDRLHGILFTSRGRIIGFKHGVPQQVAEVGPEALGGVGFNTSSGEGVYVLYPTASRGFANVMIAPPLTG